MTMRILIVPKKSKLQWDMDRLGFAAGKLLARYRREGLDADRILASHERQMRALSRICGVVPGTPVVPQEKLSRAVVARADLIVALGGDNHFQYVSQFVQNEVMAGVNSDPVLSEGSLARFTPQTLVVTLDRIVRSRVRIEKWTRLAVALNGKRLNALALSEVFLGEAARCQMSRYRISVGRMSEIQKCSGLIAATGAGSSGWYDAAGRYLFARGSRFSKTKKCFRFLAAEPFHGRLSKPSMLNGSVSRLKVRSMNDSRGVIVIDTQLEYPFPEGSEAVISLGMPLKVLIP